MLARRHALRLELTGLSAEEAAEIVTSVAEATPTATEADALRHAHRRQPVLPGRVRPAGPRGRRPRGAAGRGAPAGRRPGRADPPDRGPAGRRRPARCASPAWSAGSSTSRRWRRRSGPTRTTCSTTSTRRSRPAWCGSSASTGSGSPTRWSATRRTPGSRSSRRGRMHARTSPRSSPGRRAGRTRSPGTGWRPARSTPAGLARGRRVRGDAAPRVFAYDEAVELLSGALTALDDDPAATDEERYDLLLALARAHQLVDDLVRLRESVHHALTVAGGDPERELGRSGCWSPRRCGSRAASARSTSAWSTPSGAAWLRCPRVTARSGAGR